MIKCNITACGIIVSSAQEKTNKEGGKFLAFTIVVPIEGRDKSVKELHIGVTTEGDASTAAKYAAGKKVTIQGNLYIKKVEDTLYYNLRAEGDIKENDTSQADKIEGKMEFRVKLAKKAWRATLPRTAERSRLSLHSLPIRMAKNVPSLGLSSP